MRVAITQKDIITYRKMGSKSWHDQEWHDFMNTKKSEAIGYALQIREPYDILKDVQERAIDYLQSINFYS